MAALTAVRSGPSDSDSGVGTQMTVTSGSGATPATSVVARKPAGDHRGDVGVGQVVDVGAAGVEAVDRRLPDVEAGDVQANADRLLGKRQADVAQAYDHHVHSTTSSLR